MKKLRALSDEDEKRCHRSAGLVCKELPHPAGQALPLVRSVVPHGVLPLARFDRQPRSVSPDSAIAGMYDSEHAASGSLAVRASPDVAAEIVRTLQRAGRLVQRGRRVSRLNRSSRCLRLTTSRSSFRRQRFAHPAARGWHGPGRARQASANREPLRRCCRPDPLRRA